VRRLAAATHLEDFEAVGNTLRATKWSTQRWSNRLNLADQHRLAAVDWRRPGHAGDKRRSLSPGLDRGMQQVDHQPAKHTGEKRNAHGVGRRRPVALIQAADDGSDGHG
jgi:hypothetical protein